MPEPIVFALADSAGALFGFMVQAAGDSAQGVADAVGTAQDAAQNAVDVANPVADGEVDPLTGEPLAGDMGAAEMAEPAAPRPNFFVSILQNPLSLFAGLFLLFYLLVLMPERRKQAAAAAKRAAIKKNDRVVTTGGILGTVVNVGGDSNEITLRIDDTNNTRIRVLRSAIGSVLDSGKEDSSS